MAPKDAFQEQTSAPAPSPVTRRNLLNILSTGMAAAVALVASKPAHAAEAEPPKMAPRPKHSWGMAIDLDRCTACGACTVACKVENNVPSLGRENAEKTRPIAWMDLMTSQDGAWPDLNAETIPVPCMQCEDAPCVKVCPVGATYQGEDGIVAQIWDRCIGCRYCMVACPYSRRHFNWTAPEWSPNEVGMLNPDVATRPRGVVEKCTFCSHRVRALVEQARVDEATLTDAQMQHLPACAEACPTQAITFGDLNDATSVVSQLSKSPRAERLLEELGTKPKVTYLRQTHWREGT